MLRTARFDGPVDNPNSYTIDIPHSTSTANADGTVNTADSDYSYDAIYTAALPTTFAPGVQRDAAILYLTPPFDVEWSLEPEQSTQQNVVVFAVTSLTGVIVHSASYSGATYQTVAANLIATCAPTDVDAAERAEAVIRARAAASSTR